MDPQTFWALELIRAFQSLGGWLTPPMRFFTFLGTEEFFLLVLPLIFWCISRSRGVELAARSQAPTGGRPTGRWRHRARLETVRARHLGSLVCKP